MVSTQQLEKLRHEIDPLATFVHAFANTLEAPHLVREGTNRGFRFSDPDIRHFCLLRACRIVSSLYASVELVRAGYPQELGVLLRTVIEFCSQVDYVLMNRDEAGQPIGLTADFISNFFADDWKTREQKERRVSLRQKAVHDAIGESLDKAVSRSAGERPASEMMSRVYLTFSNYVHGRYLECMDLYGGTPGHFHLYGMSNTPKDHENVELLETLSTTASNCFIGIVQALQLHSLVDSDQSLLDWYRARLAKALDESGA
jgi:hypothetical protein